MHSLMVCLALALKVALLLNRPWVLIYLHNPAMLQALLRYHSPLGIPFQTPPDEVQENHVIGFDGRGKFTSSRSTLAALAVGNAARVPS